jgi:hypothetical protein
MQISPQTLALNCLFTILLPVVSYAQCSIGSIPNTTPTAQFINHGNGTVTDTKTGLMWKRCAEGSIWVKDTCTNIQFIGGQAFEMEPNEFTWQGALQQAKIVNNAGGFAGKTDWRLPNIKELASLIEEQCYVPAINMAISFPRDSLKATSSYWSSTTTAENGSYAWQVNFFNGDIYWQDKHTSSPSFGSKYLARLVRGG